MTVDDAALRGYQHLPVLGQNLFCSAYGIREWYRRYCGEYARLSRWLAETDRWSLDQLMAYQDKQVQATVAAAYRDVPYWRRRFDSLGIGPQDITTVAELSRLPIVTKPEVQDAGEDIYNHALNRRELVLGRTSGSTGTPLNILYTRHSIQFQWALWWRHKNWYGIRRGMRQGNFGGRPVVPYDQNRPPFWRHNWLGGQTVFSHHHMRPEFLQHYVQYLNANQFDFFSGFPSSLYVLADYLEQTGQTLVRRPKMVFAGAENTEDFQRVLIEKHFAPTTSHYGAAEYTANASRCPHGMYHIDMECGVLEVVPAEGVDSAPGRVTGRIVATGFTNRAMPLIRYDMADVATLLTGYRCPCGRQTPCLERIDGRSDSLLVTADGRRVGRVSRVFMGKTWVREAQIIQQHIGRLQVNVVVRATPRSEDVAALVSDIQQCVGRETAVDVQTVAEIPRSKSGKFRAVISTVGG